MTPSALCWTPDQCSRDTRRRSDFNCRQRLARLGRHLGCADRKDTRRLVGGNCDSVTYLELHARPQRLGSEFGAIRSSRAAVAALGIADIGFVSIRFKPRGPLVWSWRSPT